MKSIAFHIAKRYLIAKKGSQAVSFITALAASALSIAVASMFIILSVFSGLEKLNEEIIKNVNADINIKSKNSKILPNIINLKKTLKTFDEIENFSSVIEEKVYVSYLDLGEIAYVRGVDSAYIKINPINTKLVFGSYPSYKYVDEVIMDFQLNNRLQIPINNTDFAILMMPKPGKGVINSEHDIFTKKPIYTTGVFSGNEELNNYIFAPIELMQELLNQPKNSAYQIVIKLKNPEKAFQIKVKLSKILGSNYIIKTKLEENAPFWKMINTEKLMIYLIFSLVIFITTFNLAGAIIIIQLDKLNQAKSLISLGLTKFELRKIYFYTGCLIVVFGVIFGLILGSIICFIQYHFGLIMANEFLAFPLEFKIKNYINVILISLIFGILVSWIFSRLRN